MASSANAIADPDLVCPQHACAVCAGRFNDDLQIGSRDPWALAVRHAKVRAHRHPTADTEGFRIIWNDEKFEEYFLNRTRAAGVSAYEEPTWDPQVEKFSYDPDIVTADSGTWLTKVQCIYKDPGSDAVLSGPVQLTRQWTANISAYNPNHTGARNHYALYEIDASVHQGDEPICVPIHSTCVPILSRLCSGQDNIAGVDLNIVHRVITQLTNLPADYGELNSGPDCGVMGEEYYISQPVCDSGIEAVLRRRLNSASFKGKSQLVSDYKGPRNLFAMLSRDVLACIVDELDVHDLLSLSTACWPVCELYGYNSEYWRGRIDKDMPWTGSFLPGLVADAERTQELSFKKLYGWLELNTRSQIGVTKPWLGLANLRRVWKSTEARAACYRRVKAGESLDAIQADYASTAASDDEGCDFDSDTNQDESGDGKEGEREDKSDKSDKSEDDTEGQGSQD